MRIIVAAALLALSVPAFAAAPEPKTEDDKTMYALGALVSRNFKDFKLNAGPGEAGPEGHDRLAHRQEAHRGHREADPQGPGVPEGLHAGPPRPAGAEGRQGRGAEGQARPEDPLRPGRAGLEEPHRPLPLPCPGRHDGEGHGRHARRQEVRRWTSPPTSPRSRSSPRPRSPPPATPARPRRAPPPPSTPPSRAP